MKINEKITIEDFAGSPFKVRVVEPNQIVTVQKVQSIFPMH